MDKDIREILSAIGSLASCIGLVFAILSWIAAKRSEKAAEKAEVAANDARGQVFKLNSISVIHEAKSQIMMATEDLRNENLQLAQRALVRAACEISRFLSSPSVAGSQREKLESMRVTCGDFQGDLGGPKIGKTKIGGMTTTLGEIQIELSSIIEQHTTSDNGAATQ